MKKISLALACVIVCLLTSCFGEPGGWTEFPAYVLIDDDAASVSLIDFYDGKKYIKFENLNKREHLATFQLEDARVAQVQMHFEYDESFEQTATALGARKVDILPMTNATPTDSLQPLAGLLPLINYQNNTYLSTLVCVNDGYLMMSPGVCASQADKYFLMPEKVVNDTLYLSLAASYQTDTDEFDNEDIFYDLRTLSDTANTDTALRAKMREALNAIKEHKNDSMLIMLKYGEIEYNFNHMGGDTIRTRYKSSNYFKCNFLK